MYDKVHSSLYRILAEGPGDIKPDYSYFPFMPRLNSLASGVAGVVVTVLVILLIVGILGVIVGKLGSSNTAQRIGWGVAVACLIAAAIVGSAGGLIVWATNQQLV